MKLEKLYIKNLASIEEASIDFEHGPLSEDSLFLICGETGSGKTTLLDAICLALFDNTPRMEQTRQERYDDTPEEAGPANTVRTNDPRQLLRRNTGEAIVQLDFSGSDDQKYTAIWNVYRSHKKTTGNLQETKWSLTNRNNGHTYTRKTDIKEAVNQAIGLTFEQFCRTTLLAQGDFTRFLKSQESEKSEILEKLTGTGIYSKIGSQIFLINKQKKLCAEQQLEKLKNIRLLSAEEQEQISRQLRELSETTGHLRREQKSLQLFDQWQKRAKELSEQIRITHEKLARKQQQLNSEQFRDEENKLRQWQNSAEARLLQNQLTQLHQRNRTISDELATTSKTYTSLCHDLTHLQHQTEQTEQQLQLVRNTLTGLAPLTPMLENEQTLSTTLRHLFDQRKRLADLRKKAEYSRQQLPILDEQCTSLRKRADEQAELLKSRQAETERQQKLLNQKKPAEVQKQRKALEEERDRLAKAQSDVTLLSERNKNRQQARDACDQWHKKLQEIRATEQTALDEQTLKRKAAQDFEQLYQKQQSAIEDWAREARVRLHPGDQCPVCGQTITEIPTDEHFRSVLAPLQERFELLKKQSEEQDATTQSITAQRKAYEEQALLADNQLKTAAAAFNEAYDIALQSCTACGIHAFTSDTPQQLKDRTDDVTGRLNSLQQEEQEITGLNQLIGRLQQEKDRLQAQYNSLIQDLNRQENIRTARKQQAEEQTRQADDEQKMISEHEERIAPQMLWDDWQTVWKDRPEQLLERLEENGRTYRQAREQQVRLEQQLTLSRNELHEAELCRKAIAADFPDWNPEPDHPAAPRTEQLLSRWNALRSQTYNLVRTRDEIQKTEETSRKALQEFFATHPDITPERLQTIARMTESDVKDLQNRLQAERNEEIALQTALRIASEGEQQHNEQRPQTKLPDGVTPGELLPDIERRLSDAEQETGRLKTILDEDRKRQEQTLQEQMEYKRLQAEYQKWNTLNDCFGDKEGTKFRNIAQSYVLRELLSSANHYLRQFTDRYELICPSVSLTILIRDFYQGGVQRPTSTLSGGESFLVSLSLALGLSALTHDTQSVDTLFIDEGFGTLSSDYLNIVMDTLERLHQLNGKRVGIISHVEGLRERIRTQIQVTRRDHSCSEIRTVCLT